ncbi:putative RING-H2 finger protein ATL71 isoform X1 [Xyrichtys novacula]|uniref:RING-H2 finger protein ATL71 isoform X1 n=1 Tax=Xyrichtys novacula TaxID=13765 RepID=A0AAV1HQS8_XYRNO|nr:putative RING-H2 finger protein ATL71 isoform X1 [Xyrichtys novacula]
MDPGVEDVFLDNEEPSSAKGEEEESEGEESGEEDSGGEEQDAKIFNAWMQRYRGGSQQEKIGEEEEEEEEGEVDGELEGGRSESRNSLEPTARKRMDRRASLPCPNTLCAMQLSRLHSSTQAPVTARVLLRRTSSRRLVPSPQESTAPSIPERRPSLIPPTIPEVIAPERRSTFRRRNVMSLSDAYSVCLICHNDLNKGNGGTRELQCTHTFHKECIEEWFWRKQSCPTCHVQVSIPQPVYWNSTRVKVP